MPEPVVEYFRMGGYAFYVWCSYAVVFVVLALNLVLPSLKLRRVRRALARQARFANPGGDEPPRTARHDDP